MNTTWKQPGDYPLHGGDFFNTPVTLTILLRPGHLCKGAET